MRRRELIIYLTIFLSVITGVFLFMPASAKQEQVNTNQKVSNEDEKDISGIMKSLEDRERELAKREDALKKEELSLNALKNAVELSIKQYSSMRERLQKDLASNKGKNNSLQGMENLVKIYEAMSPSEAAQRIERLDSAMAVELISRLKSKHAGKIMEAMSTERAVRLTEKIATIKGDK